MKPFRTLEIVFSLGLCLILGEMEAQDRGGCDLCGPASGQNQNQVTGNFSATVGISNRAGGPYSFAVGNFAKANGGTSMALGTFVRAEATNSIVIGRGLDNVDSKALINNQSNSLMIGFNSKRSTIFVGGSLGGETTGKVGIGDVINPQAKLHIKSDSGENAGFILEPKNKNANTAYLQLFDENHKITVSKTDGMSISSLNDQISVDAKMINLNGKIGINTKNDYSEGYDYALAVDGGILTDEVYIKEVTEWQDKVFEEDYDLMPIIDLEQFVKENKHLPDVPSENEVKNNGYGIAEIEVVLLKKIEELTLYTIELNKQIQRQQEIIDKINENAY